MRPKRKPFRLSPLRLRSRLLPFALAAIVHLIWMLSTSKSSGRDLKEETAPTKIVKTAALYGTDNNNSSSSYNNNTVVRHPNFKIDFPLCLVHIGKAAGSSVSCGLGLTYADCEGMPRDRLPQTFFFHMRRQQCPKNTRTYVVTLRNPLKRLQSWFDFEKNIVPSTSSRGGKKKSQLQDQQVRNQRAMLFQECYPTFEKLVLEGLSQHPWATQQRINATKPKDMTCPERAWAAVLGVRPFSYHEWYNYEYYWLGIQTNNRDFLNQSESQNPKLFALRTEHLAEDWKSISTEPLFRPVNQRGTRSSSNETRFTYTSPTFLLESAQAREQLCHALCTEMQYYKMFLLAARNLDVRQRQASVQELAKYCPLEMTLERRECLEVPKFPRISVSSRQYRTEIKKRIFRVSTGEASH